MVEILFPQVGEIWQDFTSEHVLLGTYLVLGPAIRNQNLRALHLESGTTINFFPMQVNASKWLLVRF